MVRTIGLASLLSTLALSGCERAGVNHNNKGEDQVVLASVDGIDHVLSEENDLVYALMCNQDALAKLGTSDIVAQSTVRLAAAKDHGDAIAFTPLPGKKVVDGSYCAIDVRGDGTYKETFIFNATKDLFYASTRAMVEKKKVSVDIYRLFKRPSEVTKTVRVGVTFPEEAAGGYSLILNCNRSINPVSLSSVEGGKRYELRFDVPLAAFGNDGLACRSIEAVKDQKSILWGPFLRTIQESWDEKEEIAVVLSEGIVN